jgi:hypothetical protein
MHLTGQLVYQPACTSGRLHSNQPVRRPAVRQCPECDVLLVLLLAVLLLCFGQQPSYFAVTIARMAQHLLLKASLGVPSAIADPGGTMVRFIRAAWVQPDS